MGHACHIHFGLSTSLVNSNIYLHLYYSDYSITAQPGANADEGDGEEDGTIAGDGGDGNNKNEDDDDNKDNDDKDNNEDNNEDDDKDNNDKDDDRSTPVTVLADVYLVKTIGTSLCKTSQFLNADLSNYLAQKASVSDIAGDIDIPSFEALIHEFLLHQLELHPTKHLDLDFNINIYTSSIAIFCAPSDLCGVHGMAREQVHAMHRWWLPILIFLV